MTGHESTSDYLRRHGMPDAEIARANAEIDQARAFLDEVMPLAIASQRAYRRHRLDDTAKYGAEIQRRLRRLGIAGPANAIIEALVVIAAAQVLDAEATR